MILEHADANPDFEINDVKAFLGHSVVSHDDDSDLSLRMSDIKAAKDKFVDPQFKSIAASRRERAGPNDKTNNATQKDGKGKQRMEQVAGTDDEDELTVENDRHQLEPQKPVPVQVQLPFIMPKPSQAASSAQLATNTVSDARPLATSTTIPADSPNIKKRERSVTPSGICPAKRARHDDGTAAQELLAIRSKLMHATPPFLEALAGYIRAIERQHVDFGQEFSQISESLRLRTDPYRAALDRRNARKTLDDAKETWEQISEEKFQALQEAHWDKTTTNVTELQRAECDRKAAAQEVEEAQMAALPALTIMNETQPRLRELSMTGKALNLQAKHLGILRSLVVLGAPAIDALDSELKARGFSLKDIVQRIGQNLEPTNTTQDGSGQSSAEPTA
ncbi:hypothetical protein CEP52_004384 [Fusarium oligoseptatum]|uniref:Kinetochore protein n=1 Tax=Fusarium oligoseptatum TaxID=2604345 RepID=A0A428U421_9HYPO|nr:hypothetical protein CEP52_004384 [Fusarium oligoseptatum]